MRSKKTFSLERFFQALGDNTRLRLLNLMGNAVADDCCAPPGSGPGQEICVCYFVEVLSQPQPKISRHLAYLRSAGIVAARREGKWMHYRIVMPPHLGAAKILRQTIDSFQDDRQMQADSARMARACCNPARFVALQGAPLPSRPAL